MRISDWSSDVCSSDLSHLPSADSAPSRIARQEAMSSEVISRSVAPAATGQSSRTASRMKLALVKADGMDILQEHMDRAWLGARPRGRTQPSDIGRVPTEQQEQARGDSYQHFFNRAATAPLEMSRAGGPS